MRKIKLLLFALLTLLTGYGQTLSYKVYNAGSINHGAGVHAEINGYITTSQQKVVALFESDLFRLGSWLGAANYDYYVNNIHIGSSGNTSLTVDLSAYIPVTSVAIVSRARNSLESWSWAAVTLTVTPAVTLTAGPTVSNISYIRNATAAPLTAVLTGGNVALKWYSNILGEHYSATPPTPSTSTLGTTTYYVAQANSSGIETARSAITVTINPEPAPIIFYWATNLYTVGTAIENLSPLNFGGAVPGTGTYIYSVSPALPAGLSIHPATGVISGTPTQVSAATNYTITATNEGGSGTAVINIRVKAQAPNISYTSPQLYTVGTAIPNLTPTNTGGAVPSRIPSVTTLAGNGSEGFADATNSLYASFASPGGVAVDAAGNVYVADRKNNRIRKIDNNTSAVTTLAGNGTAGFADNINPLNASFDSPAGVALDAAGNVYVADQYNNRIRKIDAYTGAVTTLAGNGTAGFSDDTNPLNARFNNPVGVVVDRAGNVLVVDLNNHRIRKIDVSSGAVTTLAGNGAHVSADATNPLNASFGNPYGVAIDATGNVYVVDYGNHRIRKIAVFTGAVTTLAGNGTSGFADAANPLNASFSNPSGVAVDAAGNLYVADSFNHRIRRIDATTGAVTTIAGNGTAGFADAANPLNASFDYPVGVSVDANGNVYVADLNSHRIRKVSVLGYSITPALPAGLTFDQTTGVISGTPTQVSAATNYTITATNESGSSNAVVNIRVKVQAPNISYATPNVYMSGTPIASLMPTNTGGAVPGTSTYIYTVAPALPTGLVLNAATGEITGTPTQLVPATNYSVTASNESGSSTAVVNIRVTSLAPSISFSATQQYTVGVAIAPLLPINLGGAVPASGSAVATFAGGASGYRDGAGAEASFNYAYGLTTDADDNVYVADSYNHAIRKIDPNGNVTTIAGAKIVINDIVMGLATSVDGTGSEASFNTPMGVAVDNAGHVFVAEQYGNKIRKITPEGVTTTFAGSGLQGMDNGIGAAASFSMPIAVALNNDGSVLYVADNINNVIRKVVTSTAEVSTFAGTGAQGADDGAGAVATFNSVAGLAVDAAGNVFVADQYNHKIRKITPAGVVSTFAGSGAEAFADGQGIAASFNVPTGITIDGGGNLYVADQYNYRIRKITPAGFVTTIAGNGTDGDANGLGQDASFSSPTGVAVDTKGNLYVADGFNQSIRKISLLGYSINPALPAGLVFDTATGAISGTPTESRAAMDYTITATNQYGSSSSIISLATDGTFSSTRDAAANAIRIYTIDGRRIAIAGVDNAHVTVYNQVGQQVFSAKVNGIIEQSFAMGIYIVKVGNTVSKVLLK